MLQEFKEFALKGNVLDLAVGVVMATAFGAIIKSVVEDILMPAIGMIFGAPDFSAIKLGALDIGKFLNATVNFLFIAIALFILVKAINTVMKRGMGGDADEEAMKDGIKDAMKE